MNYYNENDARAAAWLRELMKENLIAKGDIDERSISDVRADELMGYTQCHFFAGIGGWSYALRLAGWPDDEPVWTGSCPCQPFSGAGKGLAEEDPRHLWPVFGKLIRGANPPVVFGEQVASALGRVWLARVFADLEDMAYRPAGADLCAAGIGAPHPRQRLFWVADSYMRGRAAWRSEKRSSEATLLVGQHGEKPCGMADADGWQRGDGRIQRGREYGQQPENGRDLQDGGMANANRSGFGQQCGTVAVPPKFATAELRGNSGAWGQFDILPFRDGKQRRVEAGTFPLAARLPRGVVPSGDPSISEAQASAEFRVARLRGYGNSIVPQLASEFILASMEAINETML